MPKHSLQSRHRTRCRSERCISGAGEALAGTVTWSRAPRPDAQTRAPEPPHELVERALAAAIASEPNAPQDLSAREAGFLAQPLGHLRRVLRHDRRAPDTTGSWIPPGTLERRHVTGALHARTPSQIRYRNRISRNIKNFHHTDARRSW